MEAAAQGHGDPLVFAVEAFEEIGDEATVSGDGGALELAAQPGESVGGEVGAASFEAVRGLGDDDEVALGERYAKAVALPRDR